MAPTLTDTDGQVVDVAPGPDPGSPIDPAQVERDFSRALTAEDPSATQGPPRRADGGGGQDQDGTTRRRRAKRSDAGKPRVAQAPKTRTDGQPVDLTEAAAGLVTLSWATVAAIPYTTPFAAVIDANAEALTGALANGAKHNPRIAAALERAAAGGGGVWALQLTSVAVNMGMQCLEIVRDPATRAAATQATQAKFRLFLAAQGINVPEQAADDAPAAA